ncbi:hypothetical protein F4810DRAFT_448501 [Camillea tinctor]|nr:hypothetical protein F4810DRAFT_448501 [Camillea tinctor]
MLGESGDDLAGSAAQGIPTIKIEESSHQQPVLGPVSVSGDFSTSNHADDTQASPLQEEITRPPTASSFVSSTTDATSPPSSVVSDEISSLGKSESTQKPENNSQASSEGSPQAPSTSSSPTIQNEGDRFRQPVLRRASLSSLPRLLDIPQPRQPSHSCPSSPRIRDTIASIHSVDLPSSPHPPTDLYADDDGKHFQHKPSKAYQEWEIHKMMLRAENNKSSTNQSDSQTSQENSTDDESDESDDSDSDDEEDRPKRDYVAVMDKLMKLKGLEEVKQTFLDILAKVEICKKQGRDLKKERFNVVFQGNPGTGMETVIILYLTG